MNHGMSRLLLQSSCNRYPTSIFTMLNPMTNKANTNSRPALPPPSSQYPHPLLNLPPHIQMPLARPLPLPIRFPNPHIPQPQRGNNSEADNRQHGHKRQLHRMPCRSPERILFGRRERSDSIQRRLRRSREVGRRRRTTRLGADQLIIEDGSHHGQGDGPTKRHAEIDDRQRAREPCRVEGRHVEGLGHEAEARARAREGHHGRDGSEMAGTEGGDEAGEAGGFEDGAGEEGGPGLARVDGGEEDGGVDAGADAGEVVEELGAGAGGRVGFDEGEVDADEVEDGVHGGAGGEADPGQ